jgi:hypothetical protein
MDVLLSLAVLFASIPLETKALIVDHTLHERLLVVCLYVGQKIHGNRPFN